MEKHFTSESDEKVFFIYNLTILNFYPHFRATEDSSICGHFIPKDTLVLANFWAVHNDPKIWDKPEEFNPNRFLSDDGKDLIKTEALIPFSIGKQSIIFFSVIVLKSNPIKSNQNR